MKALLIVVASMLLFACNTDERKPMVDAATIVHNIEALKLAPVFDRRIKDPYITLKNTVVLKGRWPTSFAGNSVAKSWCQEFKAIRYIQLHSMANKVVGKSICK